jgi:hypothetical protein
MSAQRDPAPIMPDGHLHPRAQELADAVRAGVPGFQVRSALRERAAFYARCSLLEDLAYGSQTGLSAYTHKSLAALPWLFPA